NEANNIFSKPVLTNKEVVFRLIQVFLIVLAFIIINSSFPLVLDIRYGLNVAVIGIFASISGIIMFIAGITTRKLIKKFGEKSILLVALALMMLTFISYPFLYFVWLLWIFVFPYGFSNLIIRTIIITNVSRAVDEDQQGEASGWGTNLQAIAQVFAPLIAYWFLEIGTITILGITLDAYFLIGMTCVLITLALSLLVLYDIKRHPNVFELQQPD
ncbi:MAG: MFS transporter, partial [Promethearchaeia archaeon]